MNDLSSFQRDLLYVIAGIEEPYGVTIQEELEEYYDESIFSGRLYPNLDALAEKDLIEKGEYDLRTNRYSLTDHGLRKLKAHRNWENGYLESKPTE